MNISPSKVIFSNVLSHNGRDIKFAQGDLCSLFTEYNWIKGVSEIEKIKDLVPLNPVYANKMLIYDKVEGTDLGSLYCSANSEEDSRKLIKKALSVFNKAQTVCIKNISGEPLPIFKNIYIDLFMNNLNINSLVGKYDYWIVNGNTLSDIFNIEIIGEIMNKAYLACKRPKIRVMHGNYLMSNLIFDGEGIKVIDPRGEFGNGTSILGDARFDLAKLRLSIEGYDSILRGRYFVDYNNNFINYKILIPTSVKNNLKYFDDTISKIGFDVDMIKNIEGGIVLCLMNMTKDEDLIHILYAKALELLSKEEAII